MTDLPHASPLGSDDAFKRRMETAYTDDYLRIMGIEHYRQGYFTPEVAPDDLPRALERHVEVLLDPLGIGPQHRVLELGCNLGGYRRVSERRASITSHSTWMVSPAKVGPFTSSCMPRKARPVPCMVDWASSPSEKQ